MTTYSWEFAKKADKDFQKLDSQVQRRMIKWLDDHIEGSRAAASAHCSGVGWRSRS